MIQTQFGHLVETFAVNELMKQAGWARQEARFPHFRTRDRQEVDLVIESVSGSVVAVEVKAAGTVARRCHPRVSWSWSRAPLIAVDAVAVASPCWTRFASCWRMFLIWSFIWWLKSFEL